MHAQRLFHDVVCDSGDIEAWPRLSGQVHSPSWQMSQPHDDTEHYREASRRTAGYGPEGWAKLKAEAEDLMRRFSDALQQGRAPEDPRVVELAEEHRLHIDRWFYPCSPSMHAALASMYRADSRFAASFEKYAPGLTDDVARAIETNTARAR